MNAKRKNERILKSNKCLFRPPHPPREICSTFANWILGIVSPSLMFNANSERAKRYFRELEDYHINVLEWKVQKRIANKNEYRELIIRKNKRRINDERERNKRTAF